MSGARAAALALVVGLLAPPAVALTPADRPLADRMKSAGLAGVETFDVSLPAVRGFLAGDGELEVLLVAGCGPGPGPSRDAALAAVADLARTPRRHTVELLLCVAGGAAGDSAREAAEGWLERHPAAADRQRLLAALHLEVGDRPSPGGVGLLLGAAGPSGRRLPPAWLAHATLAGTRAAGGRAGIGLPDRSLMGQLLGRHGHLRATSGAEPFLAAGVPALTLAGEGPGAGWSTALPAVFRRLDGLAGRPRDDDVFLALGGRVWSRRALYWAGMAIWVALVVAGLPGAWRGAGSRQRRRRGRRYLPGFVFRMLFLVALLAAPATTLVLLAPAALLTLLPMSRRAAVHAGQALAAVPPVLLAASWLGALTAGRVALLPAQPVRLALVIAGAVLALVLIGRPRGEDPLASEGGGSNRHDRSARNETSA